VGKVRVTTVTVQDVQWQRKLIYLYANSIHTTLTCY